MHTRALFLTLLACISLLGCKKQKKTEFEITGFKDIDIRYTEIQSIPLSVVYTSGDKQLVTLSVEGLPAGASISFIPNSNVLPYDTKMQVSTKDVAGGDYTLKVIAKPEEGTSRIYNVKMKVKGVEDIGCALELTTEYFGTETVYYNLDMSNPYLRSTNEKNRIVFTNCVPYGIVGELDCNNDKLTIPRQKVPAGYISGEGIYTGYLVVLAFQLEDSLGNINRRANITLQRKEH